MIYPIDSAYAQEVLRVNYELSAALKVQREKLATRVMGLIRHDRFLHKFDVAAESNEARKSISSDSQYISTVTIQ